MARILFSFKNNINTCNYYKNNGLFKTTGYIIRRELVVVFHFFCIDLSGFYLHRSINRTRLFLQRNIPKVNSFQKKFSFIQTVRSILNRCLSVMEYHLKLIAKKFESFKCLIKYLIKIIYLPLKSMKIKINDILIKIKNKIPKETKKKFDLFFLKEHYKLLLYVCKNVHIMRKLRKAKRVKLRATIKVLHVTCSFDLGGTQRQIKNLCMSNNDILFTHEAVEIFPEYNFLYRKNVTLDKERYIRGNYITRYLGECTLNYNFRSCQLIQIYKFVRDFQALKPDIVVGWGHEVAMLTFAAASIVKVPEIVFCIRTWNPSFGWTAIGSILEKSHRTMIPHVRRVIVNSTLLQRDYADWMNIPKEKISVCPNGIEIPHFTYEERTAQRTSIRQKYGIPDEAQVIINIGRFSHEKGQMILVKAYKRLIETYPTRPIYCLLCGDGLTQEEVSNYARSHNLTNVIFPGRTNSIYTYLNSADIFIMPSDFEGMPNAMMEAMSCGLPCISTNRSGALDIARENHEALYCDVGSDIQLYEKLCYLIERPEEQKRLGQNAKKRLEDFSVSHMISRFNTILMECISTSKN